MKKSIIIITAFLLMINLLSCSDSERRMELLGQTSTVVINLGLPAVHASADMSIIDRVLRFFTRDAIAQTAPATFSSITVRVTGADIVPIEKNFAPFGDISLNVPSGSLRQFEVIAYVAPGDPSAAASFRGTAVANLPAGETVSVPVLMTLNEAKILVPDHLNYRFVIMNDISGSGWQARYHNIFPFLCGECNISPNDIDVDSRGRLYIADGNYGLIRSDDINGTNAAQIITFGSYVAVAVDKNNDYLYYSDGSSLTRSNLDGSNPRPLSTTNGATIMSISGIDIGPDGNIYIASSWDGGSALFRYNPNVYSYSGGEWGMVESQYSNGSLLTAASDVFVRSPYVYVANTNGNARILQFPLNFTNDSVPLEYGSPAPSFSYSAAKGLFYGPRHFIGLRNDSIIIIDEGSWGGSSSNPVDRLIATSDMTWTTWNVFGSNGSGDGQFYFWQ